MKQRILKAALLMTVLIMTKCSDDEKPKNEVPKATTLSVTGTVKVGEEVTATYTYVDAEEDMEEGSTFKWYRADNADGTNEAAIVGETESTYTLTDADEGKFIRFAVTPIAATGNITGEEVVSGFFGPVAEQTTVTFMYNGASVTYGIIKSNVTQEKWLDRNLGAPDAATAVDNYQNYGDLFQWGRRADGHQLINRAGPADADMSGTNGNTLVDFPYEISNTETPAHSKFIVSGTGSGDWLDPQNSNLWQGVNGINNPCPSGWRIPTQAEWTAENLSDLADGYSKLKLTYTGVHAAIDGLFYQSTANGNYWSSTTATDSPEWAVRIRINAGFAAVEQPRAQGYACRCIKD